MQKINVIIPMAGESRRFNYEFKPFIQISDETFIELAYKYFEEYRERICKLYFIITQQQEDELSQALAIGCAEAKFLQMPANKYN